MKALFIVAVLSVCFASCSRTVYIVRHAEKAPSGSAANMMEDDPPLSDAGKVRALVLKSELSGKHIRHIYSTNTVRTRSTAEPLSQAIKIDIGIYKNIDSLIDIIKSTKGNALVVGHSNTVDDIVNKLCGQVKIESDLKDGEYDNLFIAPAGTVQSKINELLLNGKLNELFNYLEEVFDFIIVDTPPIEPVSDAYILSAYSDSTLFVVRHRYTPKAIVRLLDQNNKIISLRNVAIVFNGVKARGFIKHAYGYGYGFGYEYVYKQSVKEKKGRKAKLV